jgi:TolB protein
MTIFFASEFFSSFHHSLIRGGMLVFGLSMLLAFAAVGCGSSDSDSTDVVYSLEIAGNADLFKIGSVDEAAIRLTNSAGVDVFPTWSPNKELIAFISDQNGSSALWLMDSNGESKRQLTGPALDVVDFRWSPDSVRIAVEVVGVGGRSISILDTDTDEMSSLTEGAEDARVGDWSPDGEWVVYEAVEGADSEIRRRNPTGVDEITVAEGRGLNPRWSPNGQWIAFGRVNEDGSIDLVVLDKDGNGESVAAAGVNGEVAHEWSPDSRQLVYVIGSGSDAEIYVIGRDGKDVKQLTSNRVEDRQPRWSSNGSSILFLSAGDGAFDVYRMGKDGDQQSRLTLKSELVLGADW